MGALLHYSIRSQLPLLLKRCSFFTYRMTFPSPNCLLLSSPTKDTLNNPHNLSLKVVYFSSSCCLKPSFFVNDLSFFQPDLTAGITLPTQQILCLDLPAQQVPVPECLEVMLVKYASLNKAKSNLSVMRS